MTPFRLVHSREVTTTLDAMLPNVTDEDNVDVAAYRQRAEARRPDRLRIKDQQRTDARRYNLRRRKARYKPGDNVCVWMPIRRLGPSEKPWRRYCGTCKILCQIGELNYEFVPDGVNGAEHALTKCTLCA